MEINKQNIFMKNIKKKKITIKIKAKRLIIITEKY